MTLKTLREVKLSQISPHHGRLYNIERLPPEIKEKVLFIEGLHDHAFTVRQLKQAIEEVGEGVSDFEAWLVNFDPDKQEIMHKVLAGLDRVDSLTENPLDERLDLLRNQGYSPPPDLALLEYDLGTLWLYWIAWPGSRKWYEADQKTEEAFNLNLYKVVHQIGIETTRAIHWIKGWEKDAQIGDLISRAWGEVEEAYAVILQSGGYSCYKGNEDKRKAEVLDWFKRNEKRLSLLKEAYLLDNNLYNDGGGQERRNFTFRLLSKICASEIETKVTYDKIHQKIPRIKKQTD